MKFTVLNKVSSLAVSLLFLGITYFFGILTPVHAQMIGNDYNTGLMVATLAGFGITFGLWAIQSKKLGISTVTWLLLALLIVLQPVFHHIVYPDSLVFPFGALLLATLLSIFSVNLPAYKKPIIIRGIAWLLLITGILSACTQVYQYFSPVGIEGIIPVLPPMGRITGNLSQPNMASFVNILAIVCAYYLFFIHQKCKKILFLLIPAVFLLVLGVSLSGSRAGVILLTAGLVGGLFYTWHSHKVRWSLFFGILLLAIPAYQLGVMMLHTWSFAQAPAVVGTDRLMSGGGLGLRGVLLERAWWAFSSNPIFGVGYNNYLGFGIDNIERMSWYEAADHSHNVIAQIAAELGIVGLLTLTGVVAVLFQKLLAFIKSELSADELFLCLLLAIIILYSFSEYPLWYPNFLFLFAFLVGLLDKGFVPKVDLSNKLLTAFAFILTIGATTYTGLYYKYHNDYGVVMYADVKNQYKIDSYQAFPNIFGFLKAKNLMLHMVIDEDKNDPKQIIPIGNNLIRVTSSMNIANVQVKLLMRDGQREEADKINRMLCIWIYQQVQNCQLTFDKIKEVDPEDKMGYAKRLNDWYVERYGKEP